MNMCGYLDGRVSIRSFRKWKKRLCALPAVDKGRFGELYWFSFFPFLLLSHYCFLFLLLILRFFLAHETSFSLFSFSFQAVIIRFRGTGNTLGGTKPIDYNNVSSKVEGIAKSVQDSLSDRVYWH